MNSSSSVLSVMGLAKSFAGFRAVQSASFEVGPGEVVALIGPNGAGKTTTFNMINGQLRPDAGRVLLQGRDVTGLPPPALWRLGVARTFQITATFASLTVAENIAVALMSRDGDATRTLVFNPEHRRTATMLLERIGIAAHADRVCGQLAYGDLKRVELAMALASEPRLLLMDEPTAGMAPRERGALMTLVAALAREKAVAVLFTEHDMDVVFRHADRILVMNRGRLIGQGSPAEVRGNAEVREVYLGHGAGRG